MAKANNAMVATCFTSQLQPPMAEENYKCCFLSDFAKVESLILPLSVNNNKIKLSSTAD
jgi:hypothetical protein